jgi:glyoxylase-like metal-dependent hydrolase (beta-lactamase superfamily II)
MSEEIFEFKLGEFTCFSVSDGAEPFDNINDAHEVYPDVPLLELQKALDTLPIHARIFGCNPLIIKTKQHQVLIDTGHGAKKSDVFGNLLSAMETASFKPEDIDVVFITHYHGDHINGLVNEDNSLVFPNARYVMGKEEWKSWMDPKAPPINREPERIAQTRSIFQRIEPQLKTVKLSQPIVNGVYAVAAFGHTVGHMGVLVQSKKQRLLHIGDAAHTLLQMAHPEWSPFFDTDKEIAVETRQRLFKYAVYDPVLVQAYDQ